MISRNIDAKSRAAGFTAVEILIVLLVSMVVAAFAIPIFTSTMDSYKLRAAVASATWAIQSTRFQALEEGYPFQVTFAGDSNGNNPSYQIASEPPSAGAFANVGTSVPLSGSPVSINQTEVLQFKANGIVSTAPASNPPYQFTMTYKGTTKTITVSNYGNVSVTP